jgi:hypothetical protein
MSDTDRCLVVAKIKERLAVNKRPISEMDMDRFSLKQLNDEEVKESIRLQSKTDFQLWRTYRILGTLIGHGTLLQRI